MLLHSTAAYGLRLASSHHPSERVQLFLLLRYAKFAGGRRNMLRTEIGLDSDLSPDSVQPDHLLGRGFWPSPQKGFGLSGRALATSMVGLGCLPVAGLGVLTHTSTSI